MKKNAESILSPLDALKKYWGYGEFRPMQEEIIDSVLDGEDALVVMSTGAGKSITYQVPTLVRGGLTLVISPLISLIKDQVDALRARGISAVALHSGMSYRQIDVALDNCIYGKIKFLYIAPERIRSKLFLARLERMNVGLIVVDEAHCIWHWGHDFRPAYLEIVSLRHLMPKVPILALTASATPQVLNDIVERLELREPKRFLGELRRKNLIYTVRRSEDRDGLVRRIIERVAGSGIVYVRSREECDRLAAYIEREGIATVSSYHAALPYTERAIRQEEWMDGSVRIMVATSAFGMGIDKPDVRFVVHYHMPNSLEEYFQEAGRAGRDGRRSYAVLMYNQMDGANYARLQALEFPPLEQLKEIYDQICGALGVCYGDGCAERYPFNVYEFSSATKYSVREVFVALRILSANNYLHYSDLDRPYSNVIILASREAFFALRDKSREWSDFVTGFSRIVSSEKIFSGQGTDESEIAWWMGMPIEDVRRMLERLHEMGYIYYVRSNAQAQIIVGRDRVEKRYLYISPESYSHRQENNRQRLERMIDYGRNSSECRSRMIERYFGVESSDVCGVCDICLSKDTQSTREQPLADRIIATIGDGQMDARSLIDALEIGQERITEHISSLLASSRIELVDGFFYRVKKT
ncbi:MAG: ATP-dependent DNA helicase RecQ [Rikenellaceae bacterium]